MEYFIIDNNGKQAGPFSLDQLAQQAITPETLVWKQGMQDWTPAWKVDELKTTLEAAEAIRANQAQQQQQGSQQQQQAVPPVTPQQQQQDFQQAQQAAYEQGFQHGAASSQQPEKKKSNKNLWKMILGLIVVIFLIFAFTNPGADAHKDKVRTEVGKAVDQATSTSDNNFFTQGIRSIAKMMAGSVMDQAMDQLFEYHNYIVCSKGTVEFDGKQHTVSFGILGKVYTMNADDMVKALEDDDHLQIEESTSSSSDDNANVDESSDDENTDADNSSDDDNSSVQQKLQDKANEAMDKAADKVSKKVEEKINQKLDEAAADSSKIEKIIDKILDLL